MDSMNRLLERTLGARVLLGLEKDQVRMKRIGHPKLIWTHQVQVAKAERVKVE
jgi:hypothetical protein